MPEPEFTLLVPTSDDIAQALRDWQRTQTLVAPAFVKNVRVTDVAPVVRFTLEYQSERRYWKETNGGPVPEPWSVKLPSKNTEEMRMPDSAREVGCPSCAGHGRAVCPICSGAGRMQCAACNGQRCSECAHNGMVPCQQCGAAGKIACATCRASGKVMRSNVLKIERRNERKPRTIGEVPQFLRRDTTHQAVMFRKIPASLTAIPPEGDGWTAEYRDTAIELVKSLPSDAGTRLHSAELRVEQLAVWEAAWTHEDRKGRLWVYGSPIAVHVALPPRNVAALAVLGSAVAAVLLVAIGITIALTRGGPPGDDPTARRPGVAPRPLVEPQLPGAKGVEVDDAIVLIDDNRSYRGRIEKNGDEIVLRHADWNEAIKRSRIAQLVEDSPGFLRRLHAYVLDVEVTVHGLMKFSNPPRPTIEEQLGELQALRSKCALFYPLRRPGEWPDDRDPLTIADRMIARLRMAIPGSQPSPPPPTTDVPPPVVEAEFDGFAELAKRRDAGTAHRLFATAREAGSRADLAIVFALLFMRPLPDTSVLDTHLAAWPAKSWSGAPAADHLAAAKRLSDALRAQPAAPSLLRALAVAHALAAGGGGGECRSRRSRVRAGGLPVVDAAGRGHRADWRGLCDRRGRQSARAVQALGRDA